VGKIASIYCDRGITREVKAKTNAEGVDQTLAMMREVPEGLIFTNLVDFDMLYGHRNDAEGYARALEEFDRRLPELEEALHPCDCLVLTADHGCDPTTSSTDHSREYVPILATGPGVRAGAALGVRSSLADIGRTIAENFGLTLRSGTSFLQLLLRFRQCENR
jgi:phosphopentomutase